MTDYYEELSIDRNLDLDGIKTRLTELSDEWVAMRRTDPEQAIGMISLIEEAKSVFGSETSRKEYDLSLQGGEDPDVAKKREYNRLLDQAESNLFKINGTDYKLAMAFIDKARLIYTDDDIRFMALEAEAKKQGGDYDEALSIVNHAIPVEDHHLLHWIKGDIYWYQLKTIGEILDEFDKAINMAKLADDKEAFGNYNGYRAFFMYRNNDGELDEINRYIDTAISEGETWGYAASVKKEMEDEKKAAEEKAKREEIDRENARIAEQKRKEKEDKLKKEQEERDAYIARKEEEAERKKRAIIEESARRRKEAEELEEAKRIKRIKTGRKALAFSVIGIILTFSFVFFIGQKNLLSLLSLILPVPGVLILNYGDELGSGTFGCILDKNMRDKWFNGKNGTYIRIIRGIALFIDAALLYIDIWSIQNIFKDNVYNKTDDIVAIVCTTIALVLSLILRIKAFKEYKNVFE